MFNATALHLAVYVDDATAAVGVAAHDFELVGGFLEINIAGRSQGVKAAAMIRHPDGLLIEFTQLRIRPSIGSRDA